jgi:Predicted integral membrane protein
METLSLLFWILFYLLAPAGVVWLCRRSKALAKVGAILLLYILGLIVANLFIFPFEGAAQRLFPVQDLMTSITIPLAMPLILFACDFRNWPVRKALAALVIGLVSVLCVVVAGFWLFGDKLGEQAAGIAGMAVGVYTGGTPNLAAIKMMLGVDEGTYVLMNSFDMLVSFLFLVFLMACGIRLFRKFLSDDKKVQVPAENAGNDSKLAQGETDMYRGIFTKRHFLPTLAAFGMSVLIAGIGIGLSMLLTGKINMIVLILTLTTLAIAASFLPFVRRWEKSYDAGMYLVLIFSLVVASMVDLRSLDFREGAWLLLYIAFVIFGSLALQVLLGKVFKVDADTTVITSVAMINSPLFVPMIAEAMKNRRVILTGISIGIIGYAVGNYLGVLIAHLLQ